MRIYPERLVFPLFNSRHPRDFKSTTQRTGTLYVRIQKTEIIAGGERTQPCIHQHAERVPASFGRHTTTLTACKFHNSRRLLFFRLKRRQTPRVPAVPHHLTHIRSTAGSNFEFWNEDLGGFANVRCVFLIRVHACCSAVECNEQSKLDQAGVGCLQVGGTTYVPPWYVRTGTTAVVQQ